jgi:hypothetical protein
MKQLCADQNLVPLKVFAFDHTVLLKFLANLAQILVI